MGMSATQARFLCLTARKSNVEFEGQQINQQRTTLSNESANYYSELCSMAVPTPPSVDDYTKVTYTFNDGAMTNTITSMIAKNNGKYSISYVKQWQDDYAIVPAASSLVSVDDVSVDETTGVVTLTNPTVGASVLRGLGTLFGQYSYEEQQVDEFGNPVLDDEGNPVMETITSNYSFDQENLNSILTLDDTTFSRITNSFQEEYLKTLSREQLVDLLKEEQYYAALLNNDKLNPTSAAKGTKGWYVRYVKDQATGAYKPSFYSAAEFVDGYHHYGDDDSKFYNISCFTLGSATQTEQVFDREGTVEKDTAGRYVSIVLNVGTDDADNPITETFALTTNTITDEEAYNDAMNKYAFDQAQYDKKIQDINSQLEIVQQQDKRLELNLKQLDTEENAINTEMEAVKKVIQKNVDSSFKTFNA